MTVPPIMTFPVVGVHLPVALDYIYNCNRVTCSVTMDRLSSKSSGSYRCEVSGDAPEFKLISDTANMTIAGIIGYYMRFTLFIISMYYLIK